MFIIHFIFTIQIYLFSNLATIPERFWCSFRAISVQFQSNFNVQARSSTNLEMLIDCLCKSNGIDVSL